METQKISIFWGIIIVGLVISMVGLLQTYQGFRHAEVQSEKVYNTLVSALTCNALCHKAHTR